LDQQEFHFVVGVGRNLSLRRPGLSAATEAVIFITDVGRWHPGLDKRKGGPLGPMFPGKTAKYYTYFVR
jgi:hypothetical protein